MAKRTLEPGLGPYFPMPFVVVSSADAEGRPNAMAVAAAGVCSARPPVIGVAIAPQRYTHSLITRSGDFVVNVPAEGNLREADATGVVSGRSADKFRDLGLTAAPASVVSSPLIEEFPVNIECRVVQTARLGSHDWIMGEIVAVHADEAVLGPDGEIDPRLLGAVASMWGEYWSLARAVNRWFFSARRND